MCLAVQLKYQQSFTRIASCTFKYGSPTGLGYEPIDPVDEVKYSSCFLYDILISVFVFFCFSSLDEYKSKVVCEGERMRLNCKSGMQIAVYSAMFGRTQQGTLECPPNQRRAPSVGQFTHHKSHTDTHLHTTQFTHHASHTT